MLSLLEKYNLTSFFQKEDIQKMSKEIVKPVVNIVYNEIYPYVWFLCIYNVFLFFITLANLFFIIYLYKENKKNIHLQF